MTAGPFDIQQEQFVKEKVYIGQSRVFFVM